MPAWILDEDDALELLAFLVAAAITQVDKAAEYGPMRLLTPRTGSGELIGASAPGGLCRGHHRRTRGDAHGSAIARTTICRPWPLDDLCRAVTAHLVSRSTSPTSRVPRARAGMTAVRGEVADAVLATIRSRRVVRR